MTLPKPKIKLATIKPRLPVAGKAARAPAPPKRIAGRRGQERRKRIWLKDPHCANCGKLVAMHEFELDHRIPLHQGGPDTDDNCQVLCAGIGGCHDLKTREEGGYRARI